MRYCDMRDMVQERAALLDKKRLGKNQKATLAKLSDELDSAKQPPATPARPVTGLVDGQSQGDTQGDVYAMHRHVGGKQAESLRRSRRASRFGQYGIQPMRSRIQRTKRKTRTGGVK